MAKPGAPGAARTQSALRRATRETRLPSFSIVVPTYQRREVVCDAVRAIAAIEYPGPLELIIVVDGSTDGTEAAVAAIDCPFAKKIVSQENMGLAAARNRGAAEAAGEIILFVDDDMMCRPDIVEQHALAMLSGADAVIGHIPLDRCSPPGFLASGVARWAEERAERLKRDGTLTLFDLICGQMSIRRSLFEELGGFDRQFTHGGSYGDEDLDLGVRLLNRYDVRFNADAISYQRYVVAPGQYLQQWRDAGRADVRFARKHPTRGRELFDLHGGSTWSARFVLRPLATVPGMPAAMSRMAVYLAGREKGLTPPSRRAFAAFFRVARDIGYWAGVREAGGIPSRSKLLVLCYHAIADLSGDPILADYGIDRAAFAAQLQTLVERGFTFVGPDELAAFLAGEGRLPYRAVLLTFDDCYEELIDVARELLEPKGIAAIAFAVSGMGSGTNEWDQAIGARRLPLLRPDELVSLQRSGMEIGCHSRSHRPLTKLDDRDLASETTQAAGDFEALGLPRPRFFAYPHGLSDVRSCAAVDAAGFLAGFGLRSARVTRASHRLCLPRVEILARDRGWRFWLKTTWPRLAPLLSAKSVLHATAARAAFAVRKLRASASA